MFEPIVDAEERGQVGIGTLIVFIAMVLVAAIAAGVLINTAGVLQTQASDTGSETQEAVANQIEVVHAAGHVSGDAVGTVDMTLMKSAGSNAIDLRSMTVQYTSSTVDTTLTWDESTSNANYFTTSEITGGNGGNSLTTTEDRVELTLDTASLEAGTGGTDGSGTATVVDDGSGNAQLDSASIDTQPTGSGDIVFTVQDSSNVLSASNEFTISSGSVTGGTDLSNGESFTVPSSEFNDGETLTVELTDDGASAGTASTGAISVGSASGGLSPGSSATVALVDQSGAEFTYGISVPSTFGNKAVVKV